MKLTDILQKAHISKTPVEVSLSNGRQFKAQVKAILGEIVVFAEVPGREFFEMYVPVEHIVSLEIRIS